MAEHMSTEERCKVLKQTNEQLLMERARLLQVRLQVQLRIEETEAQIKTFMLTKAKSAPSNDQLSTQFQIKPTTL